MRGKTTIILCLGLLFSIVHPSVAQQKKEITCTGKVLDAQGRPVVGAKVAAYEMEFDGIAGNFALRKAGEVTTAEDGAFVFTSEPKPERSTFSDCKIVAMKEDLSLGWTVWSMREDAELNIHLGEPKELAGVIVDEAGKPVDGADVYANLMMNIKTNTGEEKKDWLPGIEPMMCLSTLTDSQGKFVFNNLPENAEVGLLVKATGLATTYTKSQSDSTSPIQTGQTDIKVKVPKEGRITGRILDPDTSKGIAGTKFAVVAGSSGLFYYRFVHITNDDGTFDVGGLQTDSYLLRNGGFPSMNVEVESGKTTNITVQADRLSRHQGIRGIVQDQEGKRLSNAVILTYPPVVEEVIADSNGVFTLKSERARRPNEGAMYLVVRDEERNLATADQFDESAKELDITLEQGVIISGKVVDVEGKGIPGAELSLIFQISSDGYVMCDNIKIDDDGNYEIRAIPSGCTYSVIARAEGYGRQQSQINTSDAANGRMEVEPLVLLLANLSASGIVVDELGQPVPDVTIFISGDGQPSRQTITDAKGQFTIENICSGRINIYADKRPPRRMRGRIEAQAGETDIRIVVSELDERGMRVPRQPPSLMFRSLPDIKDLNVEISAGDIENKIVLVCFFDMNQRPSRNCLMQLSKRAQELKVKDIVVIGIQASEVDDNTLSEWIKSSGVSFPVGIIETNIDEVKLKWGVKALPWLVLTDKKHTVIAEGIGLDELDAKILD